MRGRSVEKVAGIAAYLAVVAVAGVFVIREVSGRGGIVRDREPVAVDNWRGYVSEGFTLYGDPETAEIVVLEFLDFQCPFCAQYAQNVSSAARDSGAVVLLHLPLPMHGSAEAAATAFECAAEQGRGSEMYDVLFDGQLELGRVSWDTFARRAGVRDLVNFDDCMHMPVSAFPRVVRGSEIAHTIGALGTPTIVVNGIKLGRTPQSYADIVAVAKSNPLDSH